MFKGCWHAKLRALKAENDGELPDDKVAELYANYKCKFGCPPPRTPASVFVDMFEVPRPKMTGAGKYDSFEATYGTPTPLDLPPLKPGATKEIAPPGIFEKDKVQGTIPCVSCARMRCVYVKTKLSPTSMAILLEALEVNKSSYSCGADLSLEGFPSLSGHCRPYVRLKLDCSMHVEVQLYSSNVLPTCVSDSICGYCGENGHRREALNEASELLPVCDACHTRHGRARPSGRIAARFDRGGMRQERAQAAQRRHDQIQATQNRVEAAHNSRGTPPAPPANTINNVAPRPTPTGQATTVEGQDAGTGVPPRPPTLAVPNANNHQDRASAGRKRMVEDSSEEDEGFSGVRSVH